MEENTKIAEKKKQIKNVLFRINNWIEYSRTRMSYNKFADDRLKFIRQNIYFLHFQIWNSLEIIKKFDEIFYAIQNNNQVHLHVTKPKFLSWITFTFTQKKMSSF